jgi:hypothetical protein
MKVIAILILILLFIVPVIIWDHFIKTVEITSMQYTNYSILLLIFLVVVNTGLNIVKTIK